MFPLSEQAEIKLAKISVVMTGVNVTQLDKSTAWFIGFRFGREERFTCARDENGNLTGNIRFYE